jgi:hypothetical protein
MLVPTAIVMADNATRQHVLSARPTAPTVRAARSRPVRRLTVSTLRRLADGIERRGIPAPSH